MEEDFSYTGLATGALLLLVGIGVISRTVVHDDQGLTLIDRIIGYAGGGSKSGPVDKADGKAESKVGSTVASQVGSANPFSTNPTRLPFAPNIIHSPFTVGKAKKGQGSSVTIPLPGLPPITVPLP